MNYPWLKVLRSQSTAPASTQSVEQLAALRVYFMASRGQAAKLPARAREQQCRGTSEPGAIDSHYQL